MRIMKHCKVKFSINIDFVDEFECDVAPLDACDIWKPLFMGHGCTLLQKRKQILFGQRCWALPHKGTQGKGSNKFGHEINQ
jgi:hypothetical protein